MSAAEVCAPAIPALEVDERHAVKVSRWLAECGGVAVWGCLDLSSPSRQFYTPALLTDGTPSRTPHWSAPSQPERIVTDAAKVEVVTRCEVKRLRVSTRRGYGLSVVLTDASARRLRAVLEEAGPGADYNFEGSEAVVTAVVSRTPLPQWLAEHPDAKAV